jgi:hypothetical protein
MRLRDIGTIGRASPVIDANAGVGARQGQAGVVGREVGRGRVGKQSWRIRERKEVDR